MSTTPQRSTRTPRSNARRNLSSAPSQATPRPAIQLAETAPTDGSLTLTTETGELVQTVPANVAESLRYLFARVRLGEGVDLPERVGITSALSGEGVTFVTRSLALVLANDAPRRVCLVDLNWWSPAPWPGAEADAGMAEVLRGNNPLEHAIIPTGTEGLSVIPAGATTPAERPMLAHSPELEKVLVELSETFDHVVLDLPAVRATSEALRLAESSRAVAVVVNQGVTSQEHITAAIDELHGVPVLGVVLNRSSSKIPKFIRRRLPGASSPFG